MAISLSHALEQAKRRSTSNKAEQVAQPWTFAKQGSENIYAPTEASYNKAPHDARAQDYWTQASAPLEPQNYCNEQAQYPQAPVTPIEPDPLPPHSNPHSLSQTQSNAFQNSSSIPPLRLTQDALCDSQTGSILYTLTRESSPHIPSFLSSKPILQIRTSTAQPIAHIRFHHGIITSSIDLTIRGRPTTLTHSSGLIHDRWNFESIIPVTDNTIRNRQQKKTTYFWSQDKASGGAKVEDKKKHGRVVARIVGDLLVFEGARLEREEGWEEVMVSAVALVEAVRRYGRVVGTQDLGTVVGEFVG
ncbi:hypothetical protein CKM354_000189000 [Cercospora kikuchii]|uniref:Uncharacterized protein n=1 Tax=Cercospora kikuchii TaxID=84275 RepID=A0A9P3CH12_9PEZI|nr:uncharacterized protein CKM354_000189000 [Cercospora kikuchii]GIZ38473.1 hypothetical protein CKM354_000189000 [Cercospora kikuchii]